MCQGGDPGSFSIWDHGQRIRHTIIGGELFKKVAAVAKLRKRDLMKSDKSPQNYNGQPLTLDGRLDLDISFKAKVCALQYTLRLMPLTRLARRTEAEVPLEGATDNC